MMLLTAAISFLAGSLLGLRFNVKAVAFAAVAAILFFAAYAAVGRTSITAAAITAGIAVILLQVGYFSSLALAAMGYAAALAPHASAEKSAAATTAARRQRSNG